MAEQSIQAASQLTINCTENAIQEFRRVLEKQDDPATFVRIGVEGGGCSGLQYLMRFDSRIQPQDRVFEYKGVKVVCDARSLLYVAGLTIDYSGDLLGGGFKFHNPRAKRSCGCGTSFSV